MLKQGDQFAAQGNLFVIDQFYFTDLFYAAGNITEVIQQRQRLKGYRE